MKRVRVTATFEVVVTADFAPAKYVGDELRRPILDAAHEWGLHGSDRLVATPVTVLTEEVPL